MTWSIIIQKKGKGSRLHQLFFSGRATERMQLASFRTCKLLFSINSEPFLLTKHLRERDLTVRPQHLLIAFPAHLLVRLRVDIRI